MDSTQYADEIEQAAETIVGARNDPEMKREVAEQIAELDAELPDTPTSTLIDPVVKQSEYFTVDKAISIVYNDYAPSGDISTSSLSEAVSEFNTSGPDTDVWVDTTFKVISLFEEKDNEVEQNGIIADETATAAFAYFTEDNVNTPVLSEGSVYELSGGVVNEFGDQAQVKFTSISDVTETNTEIETPERELVSFEGHIVDFQSQSGFLARCPDCARVLSDEGKCDEHGYVSPEYDVRLKARLDDGEHTPTAYIQSDGIEKLTGISIRDAACLAVEGATKDDLSDELGSDFTARDAVVFAEDPETTASLNKEAALNELRDELLQRKITVDGRWVHSDDAPDPQLSVTSVEFVGGITPEIAEDALVRLRSR
jgi:ssDNA-binding replication factor A large subunit